MDKKETHIIFLGIVAVLAIVGLVLLFKSVISGEVVRSFYPYAYSYSNTQADPWPYATGTPKGGLVEKPSFTMGVQSGEVPVLQGRDTFVAQYGGGTKQEPYYPDWNRKRQPELTNVAQKDLCNALSRLGEVPAGYIWSATYSDLNNGRLYNKKCVQNPRVNQPGGVTVPFCCTPPTSQ